MPNEMDDVGSDPQQQHTQQNAQHAQHNAQQAQQQQHAQQYAQQQHTQLLVHQHAQQPELQSAQTCNIDKIDRIEIPQLWTQKPQLWFTSIEAQFRVKRINVDSTKYYIVITKLDQDTLSVIEHILVDAPAQNKYKKIKEALLKHYSISSERKIRTLISGLELGNKRPSELLAEIYRLGGPQLDSTIAKTLWLDRLPQYVQIALAAADGLSNEALGQLADKILEIQQPPSSSYLIAEDNEQQNACIEKLSKQLEMLTNKVEQISKQQYHSRSRSRNKHRQLQDKLTGKFCFYHSKFGKSAIKCTQPCSWQNQQGNEQSLQ